jgi:probable LLM family oxidoreductase
VLSYASDMEIGLYTFADLGADPESGLRLSPAQRLRHLVEEAVLADQVGLDVFGVGEHHRPDFAVSAPAIALAAIAERTARIRLTSAVTVLGSEDPIRVFQQFATLDLLSGGRAEIMAGRGSFIESFPLFGFDLTDYDELFAGKLELLLALRRGAGISWHKGVGGAPEPAPGDLRVYPRPQQEPLPVWIAVGGTPDSARRTGALALPMALAIIGGEPERFVPFVEIYRNAARRAGHDPAHLRLGINSPAYVAETSQQAAVEYYPSYAAVMNRIGRERGWGPMSRADYAALHGPRGALVLGSPDQVAEKILSEHELFGHQRFLAQVSLGPLEHGRALKAIELLGTRVAPQVRRALQKSAPQPLPGG